MIAFWTAFAAVAAGLSALMASIYTWLTFRLVRAQAEPNVVVYACDDRTRPSIIMIKIVNIGRDVATDVAFSSSRPIPGKAYGISADEARVAEPMKAGPLIDGVPVLGPGDSRNITWGQFGGLTKSVGSTPIDITITYKHRRRRMTGHSRLEVASFAETDASTKPDVRSAESLEAIAKTMRDGLKELKSRPSTLRPSGASPSGRDTDELIATVRTRDAARQDVAILWLAGAGAAIGIVGLSACAMRGLKRL